MSTALGWDEKTLELSMGMSGDYELAIQMGSTNVRVGSTIFGARPPKDAPGKDAAPADSVTASSTTDADPARVHFTPTAALAITETQPTENATEVPPTVTAHLFSSRSNHVRAGVRRWFGTQTPLNRGGLVLTTRMQEGKSWLEKLGTNGVMLSAGVTMMAGTAPPCKHLVPCSE